MFPFLELKPLANSVGRVGDGIQNVLKTCKRSLYGTFEMEKLAEKCAFIKLNRLLCVRVVLNERS